MSVGSSSRRTALGLTQVTRGRQQKFYDGGNRRRLPFDRNDDQVGRSGGEGDTVAEKGDDAAGIVVIRDIAVHAGVQIRTGRRQAEEKHQARRARGKQAPERSKAFGHEFHGAVTMRAKQKTSSGADTPRATLNVRATAPSEHVGASLVDARSR